MSLPFRDDFADLSKWTVVRGTWSIPGVTPQKHVGFRCYDGELEYQYLASMAMRYAQLIPNTIPVGTWVLRENTQVMTFDSATDDALAFLDGAGVKVVLEVIGQSGGGMQYANSIETLINNALSKYGSHPCVVGFGVELEARGYNWYDFVYTTDEEARSWRSTVKAFNTKFKLYLKHWVPELMPPTERSDIVFVSDAQGFGSLQDLLNAFIDWGNRFPTGEVQSQIGYESDRAWWSALSNPPYDITTALFSNILNVIGVMWVQETARTVFP